MVNVNVLLKGRYSLVRKLGQGGMGEVYLADDKTLGREVAVKKVSYAGNDFLLRAAEKEAMVLARLQHTGLPKVLDYFNEEQTQYIVMEYIPGMDLGEMLRNNRGPFAASQVLEWATPLLDILEYLHAQHPPVVHRDIKPANVKINSSGKLFLLDFGLVKDTPTRVAGSSLSASVYGYSQSYAPLEQINGDPTSVQTDVYGVCATLYHLLTNVKPADALDRATKLVERKPDSLRPAQEVNPEVPPALSRALEDGLRLSSEDRVRSAQALRQLLAAAAHRHGRIRIDLNPAANGNGSGNGNGNDGGAAVEEDREHEKRRLLGGGWKLYGTAAGALALVLLLSFLGYRWWQQSVITRKAQEQLADAQALERSEGLLSQSACIKYRGVDSDALDPAAAREVVRKVNDCASALSLYQDAERAEAKDGLYGPAADSYRKIAEAYPGSAYARMADKKLGDFQKSKDTTLRAWKEMMDAVKQMPSAHDNFRQEHETWTKLANSYELIGTAGADPDLAAYKGRSSTVFREVLAAIQKRIQEGEALDAKSPAKRAECYYYPYPQTCHDTWYQEELRKIEESFNALAAPLHVKLDGLKESGKTLSLQLTERYRVEFKHLWGDRT